MPGEKRPKSKKPGFYAKGFEPVELSDLSIALTEDLAEEIAMLRVVMRRVFERAACEVQDLDGWREVLSSLGTALTRLARLLQTQKQVQGDSGNAVSEAINQALSEIMQELKIE